MEKEQIKRVIEEWFKMDQSFHAARALHNHGVRSEEVFAMKDDHDLSYSKWYTVWYRLRELEEDYEKNEATKSGTNAEKGTEAPELATDDKKAGDL